MILNICFFFLSAIGINADSSIPFVFGHDRELLVNFKNLLVSIREKKISPNAARNNFADIMRELNELYPNKLEEDEISNIVFPLVGSNLSAVGGKGKGYYVYKFDLFDQSVSGSHPAHDIFIYDPDQDCIDNRKNKYIDIVSVSNGLVLAVESNWSENSIYRGGNYVWVYDFERGGLWYYAHHRKVYVEPGQIIKPGDKIGEVGRTGAQAASKRSDTHLHLMFLKLNDNYLPEPINYYKWLQNSKVVYSASEPLKNKISRKTWEGTKLLPLNPKKIRI